MQFIAITCLKSKKYVLFYMVAYTGLTIQFFDFRTLTRNIRQRRGEKVAINVPSKLFLANLSDLSQRLIGELKVYPWSGVRPSVVHPSFTMLKHFLLINRLADQSQILCGASLGRGTKFCSRHVGHMTKMAPMPIYGKNPSKIFFSGTGGPISTKLGM